MKKVLMLDLCHTLYLSNTTFDFLDFFLTGRRKYIFSIVRKNFLLRKINYFFVLILKFDFIKYVSIRLLKGFKREHLESSAKCFISTIKENKEVLSFINKRSAMYDEIIIVSASLDFIVKTVVEIHNYSSYVSSELVYNNNDDCSGLYKKDILHKKLNSINDYIGSTNITFITDNFTDVILSRYVSEFIAVYKTGDDYAESFWNGKGIDNVITYA